MVSLRGAQGGYRLGRPADRVTLRDVYEAFEDGDGFVSCIGRPQDCGRSSACVAREAWSEFFTGSMRILEGISLADLAGRVRQGATAAR